MNNRLAKRDGRKAVAKAVSIDPALLSRLIFITFLALAIYTITVTAAYAQAINTPMGQVICNIVNIVYGNLGRGLITLAIMTVGVGATMGKVTWGTACMVGIGCSIVGNAGLVLNELTGLPTC